MAKLRWEQINNNYLRNEDAWLNHNRMIQKLEAELHDVEAAQKGLDRFPNCFAPVASPKPHGPQSKLEYETKVKHDRAKEAEIDSKLEEQFPFIKQLFIGPMTLAQARKNKMLREALKEGDFEDLSILLPSENMRLAMEAQAKKLGEKIPGAGMGDKKKSYEQQRMDKERAKILDLLENSPPRKASSKPKIGPLTREEWLTSRPELGPMTKGEAMLPDQKDHRHAILSWLRKPWLVYDEQAAGMLERLGSLAVHRLEAEAKARGREEKAEKEEEEKMEKVKKERAKQEKEKREKEKEKREVEKVKAEK